MCDHDDIAEFRRSPGERGLNRRQFSSRLAATGGATVLAACGGGDASAGEDAPSAGVVASEVAIPTPTGTMGGWFYHPATGSYPAVIMWPDIAGVRPASRTMGKRLAGEGYAVIVPDPYWRDTGHAIFADFADFAGNDGFKTVTPYRDKLSPEAVMDDAKAIVAWLDAQDAVDTAMGIGARGHCMTGSWTIYAANAVPERIKAAASMHGGGLVTDADTSPHRLLLPSAQYLIAIGKNDAAKDPAAEGALRKAADEAGTKAEIEVYAADHGWTVPDSPAYDKAEAERAWSGMQALFDAAL